MGRPAAPARLFVYGPSKWPGWPSRVKRDLKDHFFYIIHRVDGRRVERPTGLKVSQIAEALDALKGYLAESKPIDRADDPFVTAAIAIYSRDKLKSMRNDRSSKSNLRKLHTMLKGERVSALTTERLQRLVEDGATRRDIETLQAAINYANAEGLSGGPKPKLKLWKPDPHPPREGWLTMSEASRLVLAAKGDWELLAFILFTLHTTARAEAVITLGWRPSREGGHIAEKVIDFRPVGWKQTKKRRVIIPIPNRLLWLIRALRKRHLESVVLNTGHRRELLEERLVRAFKGAKVEPVLPHELCHTGISWLMQRGPEIWKLSKFTGRSPKMLEERYGHLHPDHLAGIARGR